MRGLLSCELLVTGSGLQRKAVCKDIINHWPFKHSRDFFQCSLGGGRRPLKLDKALTGNLRDRPSRDRRELMIFLRGKGTQYSS
jgi:hypothetical protein